MSKNKQARRPEWTDIKRYVEGRLSAQRSALKVILEKALGVERVARERQLRQLDGYMETIALTVNRHENALDLPENMPTIE